MRAEDIRTITLLGAGMIGMGWHCISPKPAIRFLYIRGLSKHSTRRLKASDPISRSYYRSRLIRRK